jgi:hypothetical protein
MSASTKIDADDLIWGAAKIAVAANVVDECDKPDMDRVYYLLQRKLLPASKAGKTWVSTLRRLRAVGSGEASKTAIP